MKKEYDFAGAQRGRFYKKGMKMRLPDRRTVDVHLKVTKQVAAALHALIATGLFGDGATIGSAAEELLRHALRDPAILAHWQKRRRKGRS